MSLIYKWLPATILIEEDWSNSFFMEYIIRLMCLIYCLISVEIRLWKRASRLQNYTLSMYIGCDLYSTFLLYYSSNWRNCRFSNIIIWFIVSYQLILFIHFNLIISMHFLALLSCGDGSSVQIHICLTLCISNSTFDG